jgi:membrane-bound lytic murein transglycosylase B
MTLRIKRVLNTLKERIASYIKKAITENTHYTKMASFALVGVILPLSMIPVMATNENEHYKSDIVLSKSATILTLNVQKVEIKPGESKAQIEARERAEAEARAKAEAEKKITQIVTKQAVYSDPADFNSIYQSAGSQYGIDWRILKAIHYVETGCSGSTYKRNPSGATGPMQFMPATWRAYGIDGNGDGVKDISNVEDAIYAAANYLRYSGGSVNNYQKSLWSYNPSSRYYAKVMTVAKSLGF